jgi:hypothetical protein
MYQARWDISSFLLASVPLDVVKIKSSPLTILKVPWRGGFTGINADKCSTVAGNIGNLVLVLESTASPVLVVKVF